MATLNIKSVPDGLYKRLKERAKNRRRSISQEVLSILEEVLESAEPRSLLELKGLGKDLWSGRDAAAWIEEERSSWD
jgi:plasmid stability protein